jgi:hypothetical protein
MSLHKQITGVVGSEIHGLSSWIGETKRLWIKLDCDPKELFLSSIKSHIIDASDAKERPTEDHFYAYCFMDKT